MTNKFTTIYMSERNFPGVALRRRLSLAVGIIPFNILISTKVSDHLPDTKAFRCEKDISDIYDLMRCAGGGGGCGGICI